MDKVQQLIETLRRVLGHGGGEGSRLTEGTVTAVDESKWTCTVELPNKAVIEEVQLKALKEAEKGCVLVPKTGSTVQMVPLGGPDYLMIGVEEVDKIYADAETEIVFNGGENGGLAIVPELRNELEKINDILNAIISVIKKGSLVNTDIVEPGNGLPSKFCIELGKAIAGKTLPQYQNIENPKIKH